VTAHISWESAAWPRRTLNGIDALPNSAVRYPGGIGNPTATGGNQAVKDVSRWVQSLKVRPRRPPSGAVSLDVGCKKRDQPAFGIARFGQGQRPRPHDVDYSGPRGGHLEIRVLPLFLGIMTSPLRVTGRAVVGPSAQFCLAGRCSDFAFAQMRVHCHLTLLASELIGAA